ncbi:hypothetical protein INT43_003541, partial [Umbelopsis isabellina]
GTNELAAFALASMLAGLTGWSIAVGIATAMDSSHDGEEESQDIDSYLSIQFQKTLLALAVLLVPVGVIWWNAAILLTMLGQDNEIVALCGMEGMDNQGLFWLFYFPEVGSNMRVHGIINLAAHSILMMVASSTFILPFGISVSAATRIDHWLEYDEPTYARRSLQAAFFLSTMFGVVITIFYRLVAQFIAAAFTSQPDTASILIDILPLVGICQLFEGISTVASGALRGLNRHLVGTYTTLLTYYCLIFPLAFLLSFAYDMSLSGLWYAMIVGFAVNSVGLLLYLKGSVDWNREVELANNRECDDI